MGKHQTSDFQFNAKLLPPIPPWMSEKHRDRWARSWRSLHRDFRHQLTEDQRYWQACQEAVGSAQALLHLGPKDAFSLQLNVDYAT
jgi:hypothetical protein